MARGPSCGFLEDTGSVSSYYKMRYYKLVFGCCLSQTTPLLQTIFSLKPPLSDTPYFSLLPPPSLSLSFSRVASCVCAALKGWTPTSIERCRTSRYEFGGCYRPSRGTARGTRRLRNRSRDRPRWRLRTRHRWPIGKANPLRQTRRER